MGDKEATILGQLHPVVFNTDAPTVFQACYTEQRALVDQMLERHPTLTPYTLCSWGTETWLFRGFREVNLLGFLVGAEDLGVDFSEMLAEA